MSAPASAAQVLTNQTSTIGNAATTNNNTLAPGTGGGTLTTGGGFSALMSEAECTRAGGRVASNPSCYSGKQCRGIMNQDCISKAQ